MKRGLRCVVLFCLTFVFAKEVKSEIASGILEHLTVCGEGKSESFYCINTGVKRIRFKPPPNMRLPSGREMSIEGDWISGKFIGREIRRLDDWTPPPNITVGKQRTLILNVHSPDKPPSNATIEAIDHEAFYNSESSLNSFFTEASSDQNGNRQIWFEGDTFGWYVLPHNSYEYGGNYDGIMADTIKVADKDVDFSKYDRMIIISWNLFGYSAAYSHKIRFDTNDGIVWLSAAFMNYDKFFMGGLKHHEMGHTFGECWAHAGGVLIPEKGFCKISELIHGLAGEPCVVNTYFDNRDIMGNSSASPLPSGWRKKKSGWLRPEQCLEVRQNMIFWIDQRELPSSGFKLAEIPTGFNAWGEPTSYSLEYFVNGLGKFDKDTINDGKKTGVSLRYHAGYYGNENTAENDSISFYIDQYYNWLFFDRDYYQNEEFGFEIKILGYEGNGTTSRAQIQIEFFCPGKVAPTVSLDIKPKKVYAGEIVDFNVSVENNQQVGCGTQTCAIAITKPWQQNLGEISTGAYQTTDASFKVAIPPDSPPGVYKIEVSATDIDEQNIITKTSDTITVIAKPTPTPSPTPKPSPTPPKPTPTPSPTPSHTVKEIKLSPEKMTLKNEEEEEVVVTLVCENEVPVPGEKIFARVKLGKRRLIVYPEKRLSDKNGKAVFTVRSKKSGGGKVEFVSQREKKVCKVK